MDLPLPTRKPLKRIGLRKSGLRLGGLKKTIVLKKRSEFGLENRRQIRGDRNMNGRGMGMGIRRRFVRMDRRNNMRGDNRRNFGNGEFRQNEFGNRNFRNGGVRRRDYNNFDNNRNGDGFQFNNRRRFNGNNRFNRNVDRSRGGNNFRNRNFNNRNFNRRGNDNLANRLDRELDNYHNRGADTKKDRLDEDLDNYKKGANLQN